MNGRRRRIARVGVAAVVALGVAPHLAPGDRAATPPTCAPVSAPGGEWRSYGHDLSNTRTQDQETTISPSVAPGLTPVWTFSSTAAGGSGDFTATPVVADGCLFAGSNKGWVFAINADTGDTVWKTQVTTSGGVSSTVDVDGGRVYVGIANVGAPALAALDETTGAQLWQTRLDDQKGGDEYGSPVALDETVTDPTTGTTSTEPVVFIGVSGGAAELGPDSERFPFQGNYSLVNGDTGAVLAKTYTIHSPATSDDYAGATVWSTPAIDPAAQVAYIGTGNPFKQQAQSPHADAILKVDMKLGSPTFGQILAYYDGVPDTYNTALSQLPCVPIPNNPPPYYPQGLGSCTQMDLDFGAAPNLWTDPTSGHLIVGEGQKAGIYHAVDTTTMTGIWQSIVGPPSAVGGIVGSTAFDGHNVYGPITLGGYVWSLKGADGSARWVSPVGDAAHWGNPVSVADGVVYSVDLTGNLDAYDAGTGAPLLKRPLIAGSSAQEPVLSWGGVSIARNTVYAAVGTLGLGTGYIVAFKAGSIGLPPLPGVPSPPPPPAAAGSAVVAGPEAQFAGYATRATVASRTGTLTFYNADIVEHDVVSTSGLFSTPLIGLGQSAQVQGLQNLTPGNTYSFYCTIHPGMTGTLLVTP